jgi:hypothetical protein
VKRLSLLLVMLVLGTMPALRAADAAPTLTIDAALKIAQDYLKNASPSDPRFISALSLERTSMSGGASYWYARWSAPIIDSGKGQVGLRIDMDGSLTKVVSEKGAGSGSARTTWGASGPSVPVPGLGSQPYGVRNAH